MLKPIVAGAALLALAGSTFVYAQQGYGGHGGYGNGVRGPNTGIVRVPPTWPHSPTLVSLR